MAKALRIDSVSIGGGVVNFGTTTTQNGMPASPSKKGIAFANKAAIIAAMQQLENRLSDEDLLLLLIATAYKTDAALNNAATLIGKTVKLSLVSGADLIALT